MENFGTQAVANYADFVRGLYACHFDVGGYFSCEGVKVS